MTNHYDVIIIGAGIAGSSCAIQLAKTGAKTLLMDRQAFPRHKTCGEFLSPESREMLEYLGVRICDLAVQPSRMDHAKLFMPNGGEISAPFSGHAHGMSRFELDRFLHEKAAEFGCEVLTQVTVTDVTQLEEQRYKVEARQKGVRVDYYAKLVIGAFGTKKPRSSKRLLESESRDKQIFVGFKSHFSGIEVPSRVELYLCKDGYVGISPVEKATANVAALMTLETIQGNGKSVTDMLYAASKGHAKLAARLAEGRSVPGTQVGVAPIRLSNHLEPWSEYPHIGDALLMIPPLCGDGMSIALRSSILVSKWTIPYLQGAVSYEVWKNGYTEDANQEFAQLLRRARRFQKFALAPTNRYYPLLVRLFPAMASYFVKATRLPEMGKQ
ncbi:FAD-dependent oxidoreductase [Pullulanibacillus sp. KACC 23026]|uniref:FAD-dependent oxidoreductase n=1 Tax=Pullulanibacillus sp. KACC 23026 TaxID=3028315 RepID=UPI0023B013AE|nr:FAD-dependent oxidoreductase [Pullulanibacillus sp. KACC 23026]WEG14850.1 FAD-dependent oxidoreductase [Pullulanibacillus sp. KACC 23026]